MRIRIALAVAMAATFITSFAVSLSNTPTVAAAGHHTTDYSLTAFHLTIRSNGQRLTTSLLAVDQQLFDTRAGTDLESAQAPTTTAPSTTTTTTTAPPPPPPPPPPPTDATSTTTADWQCIRVHESGDEYNDPARPSGAYGILEETWRSYGYNGWPYQAAPALQDALALKLYNEYGWQPWSTRFVCGL